MFFTINTLVVVEKCVQFQNKKIMMLRICGVFFNAIDIKTITFNPIVQYIQLNKIVNKNTLLRND